MKNENIEVSLVRDQLELDIRISKFITWTKLRDLLKNSYINNKLNIDNEYKFKVIGKEMDIKENESLSLYPISNGDIIELISKDIG